MKYRPEIDGLKALAMMAVVLFHAGFGWFKGGFVGVDVFFVISGYLIATTPAFLTWSGHLFFTRVLRATGQTNFCGVVSGHGGVDGGRLVLVAPSGYGRFF